MDETEVVWCEALVDESSVWRTGGTSECSRSGYPKTHLANAHLCWQHEQKAERYGELELKNGRTLVVDTHWSEGGWRRIITGARIVDNVTHLSRVVQERPRR